MLQGRKSRSIPIKRTKVGHFIESGQCWQAARPVSTRIPALLVKRARLLGTSNQYTDTTAFIL
jgi:hypothetical protein